MTQPGDLNKKISIERNTPTRDELNAEVAAWAEHAAPWAKVADLSSREIHQYFEAEQIQSKKVTRFTVYRSSETDSVTGEDQIVYRSKNYKILTTRDTDDERFIEILAEVPLT